MEGLPGNINKRTFEGHAERNCGLTGYLAPIITNLLEHSSSSISDFESFRRGIGERKNIALIPLSSRIYSSSMADNTHWAHY